MITTPWAYFIEITLLIVVAGALARILPKETRKYDVPLESLRGLLATSVLFCHAVMSYFYFQTGKWLPPASTFYDYLGSGPVVLFFFLSGFLFWSKCIQRNGVGAYGAFLLARIRRLVPTYYTSVAVIVLIVLAHTRFRLAVSPLKFAQEIAPWLLFAPTQTMNGYNTQSINAGVTWTLFLEITFYLILPLLFLLFKGARVLIYVGLMGIGYRMIARHGAVLVLDAPIKKPGALIALLLIGFFGFGFGLGMVTAFLNVQCPQKWKLVLRQRRWTAIPLLCLGAPLFFKSVLYTPDEYLLLFIVFVFVVAGNDLFGLLSLPAVYLLGRISYSFYITHGIILFVVLRLLNSRIPIRTMMPLQYWSLVGVMGVCTVCFAVVLHFTVERRFMKPSTHGNEVFPNLVLEKLDTREPATADRCYPPETFPRR